jgi:hypothetical protein
MISFFGLNRRQFTRLEIQEMGESVASAVAKHWEDGKVRAEAKAAEAMT